MGSLKKMGKVGILSQPGRGGVLPNPNFLAKFPKTKFALQLSINVMKHTLHKWGGNISSIHNVIGPPGGPPKRETGKVGIRSDPPPSKKPLTSISFHVNISLFPMGLLPMGNNDILTWK